MLIKTMSHLMAAPPQIHIVALCLLMINLISDRIEMIPQNWLDFTAEQMSHFGCCFQGIFTPSSHFRLNFRLEIFPKVLDGFAETIWKQAFAQHIHTDIQPIFFSISVKQ